MPKITILPENHEIFVKKGERLLDILINNNTDILSICGGMGECETCVVEIKVETDCSKNKIEKSELLQTLACQTSVERDIFIKIPDWRKLF